MFKNLAPTRSDNAKRTLALMALLPLGQMKFFMATNISLFVTLGWGKPELDLKASLAMFVVPGWKQPRIPYRPESNEDCNFEPFRCFVSWQKYLEQKLEEFILDTWSEPRSQKAATMIFVACLSLNIKAGDKAFSFSSEISKIPMRNSKTNENSINSTILPYLFFCYLRKFLSRNHPTFHQKINTSL